MIARVLVTGAGGMLGTAMRDVLGKRAVELTPLSHSELDITDRRAASRAIHQFADNGSDANTAVVVNAAAFTDVEGAESNPEVAFAVNEQGALNLAIACRDVGLAFVHVSTDFVFDGTKTGPYAEGDVPNPLSVYGASKLAGEIAVAAAYPSALIVRTSWVYGTGGSNFPGKIIALARERDRLSVVTDEIGSPTYALDLAGGLLELVGSGAHGLYHLAGSGACSRFELAAETLRLARLAASLEPVTADAFPSRVARPLNSVLDCSKARSLGVSMRAWDDALRDFISLRIGD